MSMQELSEKYTLIKHNIDSKKQQYESYERQVNNLLMDIQNNTKEVKHLDDTLVVFKAFQDKLTNTTIHHVEDLVNHALDAVFNDETIRYYIHIETTQSRNNNTAQFVLHKITEGEEIITNISNNGFGIQSLIGFVIQVYFILQHQQAHILFLDESLTAISVDKLPKLKTFIKEVSKKYNFHFVLIAHVESLFELADYAYSVENGNATLQDVALVR